MTRHERAPELSLRPLVLASASPRRRELLGLLDVDFEVVRPAVEELSDGDPATVVLENARRKAAAGAALVPARSLVLGADTDVAVDGALLGKAADAGGARERLRALAGRTHEVHGAIALRRDEDEWTEGALTLVTFRELLEGEIERYLASGEWEGRAGAYAVQGLGASLVERVDGDLSNVIGLPIPILTKMMANLQKRE